MVGSSCREGPEVGRDDQISAAVVWRKGDSFHAAVGGGGAVFKLRGGGKAVGVQRAGESGGEAGFPFGRAGGGEGGLLNRDRGRI